MGLGLFRGGEGVVRFFAERGDDVIATDLRSDESLAPTVERLAHFKNVRFKLGGHDPADFETADLLVVNPAVPSTSPYLLAAAKRGVPITTEIELFLDHVRSPVLAVTGSNGKSTTTRLLFALLEEAGLAPYLAGNIGVSLLPVAEKTDPSRPCVCEISSFQLERLTRIENRFAGGIITNLTPNHLDRHPTFADYVAAKARVIDGVRSDGKVVVNASDPESSNLARRAARRDRIALVDEAMISSLPALRHLPGKTNAMNFLEAVTLAEIFSPRVSRRVVESVAESFRGIEHRLELYARRMGVLFVNDSKATTPEAARAAIGAFDGPVHLIAGGYDKKLPSEGLIDDFLRCRSVHLIGQTAEKLAQDLAKKGGSATVHADLRDAVEAAAREAKTGHIVLLSPAHPSWGMFSDYRARGAAFRAATASLGGMIEFLPPALPETPESPESNV